MGTLWNALMCKAPRRMISFFPFFYTKVKFLCVGIGTFAVELQKNLTNSVTSNKYYLTIIEEDMEDTNQHTTTIEIKAFLFHFFSSNCHGLSFYGVQRNWPPQILDFNIDPVLYTKQRWISNSLQLERAQLLTTLMNQVVCVCALSSETRNVVYILPYPQF